MMKTIALLVGVLALAALAGCAVVAGDTVMGYESGKFVYHDGSLQSNYKYPLDQVWEASRKTMADLKATDIQADRKIEKGTIEGVLTEEKVKITVEYLTRTDTSVSVRVGTAGSNVAAKFILDRIEANLRP
ncbi:MAG TPA: DUF3568 family protein [Syntrophales bacterium]|nr:DUF3568 family protein [Syntrophales bacterium]